jgi:hypothetical protein
MSKQSSDLSAEEVAPKANGKKRHGIWCLYMKYAGPHGFFGKNWIKVRSYESEKMAKENMKRQDRKWNQGHETPHWEFKVEET